MRERHRFGETLKAQRVRAGLSQEELGRSCRLHRTEISLLERGERDPRLSTIVRLANCLGVRPSELVAALEDGEDRLGGRPSP